MGPRSCMVRLFRWLKNRIKALDLFFNYVEFCGRHWQEVLGGPFLLFLAWNVWFYVGNPPSWVNWTAILFALLIAGYYAWRVDHIRLMPRLGVGDISTVYTSTGLPNQKRRYVQVLLKCETEGPIKNCRGQLLRISKRIKHPDVHDGRWETTHINETLDLLWSFVDEPTITLEHGAPRRLNIFFVENTSRNMVTWSKIQVRLASAPLDHFKFDVRIAGDECKPEYISVEVAIGDQWNDLSDLRLGKN